MGQQRDYAALARELGGTPAAPAVRPSGGSGATTDYAAIARQLGGSVAPGRLAEVPNRPPMEMAVSHRRGVPPQTVGRFAKEATQSINPVNIASGISESFWHPVDTVSGVLSAHDQMRVKGQEAFKRGDYVTGLRHFAEYALPIATGVVGGAVGLAGGPPGVAAGAAGGYALGVGASSRLNQSAERLEEGDIVGSLGAAVDTAGMLALGARGAQPASSRGTLRKPLLSPPANPMEASAVAFGRARGVPLDAATATGRPFVRNVQKKVGSTYGGANSAERMIRSQDVELARVGTDLAAEAGPRPMNPVAAGESVRAAITSRIQDLHTQANTAYSRLRELEDRAPDEMVVERSRTPPTSRLDPDRSFVLRWLADDLREMPFQSASRMRGVHAIDELANRKYGDQPTNYSPRVAGTPTQEMFHAIGMTGSRAELAAKIDNFLLGKNHDPRLQKLADVMSEGWDGQRFDFDLVSDDALTALGVRRRSLRSPITLPDFAEPGAARYFPDEATPGAPSMRGNAVPQRLPVDLASTKNSLRPMYDRLKREAELIPMQGDKARALAALDRLMQGPDAAPLSIAESALGELKALARSDDLPELRGKGAGIAAAAVRRLDAAVRGRAAQAGHETLTALDEGRRATRNKYAAAEVLELLSAEPRQVFNQLTASKDIGAQRLRAVSKIAPEAMPDIARAFLEDLVQQATEEGGFLHTDRLMTSWHKLGAETKARLFPKKGQIADLDNFFLLAKKIKENPNPSGTAQTLTATNLLASIPSWALAKMLYSPEAVKALTTARMARGGSQMSRGLALAQITRAARSVDVPLELIPALAERPTSEPSTQSRRR